MKKSALVAVVLASLLAGAATLAQQQVDNTKGVDVGRKAATESPMPTAHPATGVVKKIDSKASNVTIAHGPVDSLNWAAMTMTFKVRDRLLFDKLATGKKVRFEFVEEDGDYVLTAVH
jgi:Cu(I)/Ag(I) efflux system protein CusF